MLIFLAGFPIVVIFRPIATFLFSIYSYTNLNPNINLFSRACILMSFFFYSSCAAKNLNVYDK